MAAELTFRANWQFHQKSKNKVHFTVVKASFHKRDFSVMPSVASAFSMLLPCQGFVVGMHNLYLPFSFSHFLFFFARLFAFLKEQGAAGLVSSRHWGWVLKVYKFTRCHCRPSLPAVPCQLLHILMKLECTHYNVTAVTVSNTAASLSASELKLMGFNTLKLHLGYLGTP